MSTTNGASHNPTQPPDKKQSSTTDAPETPTRNCWVYFDVDKSAASIGGTRGVNEFFGMDAVKVNHGIDQAKALIKEITKKKKVDGGHDVFSNTTAETRIVFNEHGQKAHVRGVIIDTLSVLFRQQKQMVIHERNKEMKSGSLKSLDMRAWGLIRDDVDEFLGFLSNCSFPVVVNVHCKHEENNIGKKVLKPEIQGSAQEAMLAYPDLTAYAVTGADAPDGHDYGWFIGKDAQHEDTKSRAHGLPDTIPQDFQILLDAFKDVGQDHPFIMILGKAGQGKTSALRTLNVAHEKLSEHLGLTDFASDDEDEGSPEDDTYVRGDTKNKDPEAGDDLF